LGKKSQNEPGGKSLIMVADKTKNICAFNSSFLLLFRVVIIIKTAPKIKQQTLDLDKIRRFYFCRT